jgi:hypothetical protein
MLIYSDTAIFNVLRVSLSVGISCAPGTRFWSRVWIYIDPMIPVDYGDGLCRLLVAAGRALAVLHRSVTKMAICS